MSEPRSERAIRWLKEQLEQLKTLRNASTRAPEFKQWRQATLTIIQRIWPGDAKRSARFRKVPFSPPSTRASTKEAREAYERGCAEAAKLLEHYATEVELDGLTDAVGEGKPPSLDMAEADDEVPVADPPEDELQDDAPRKVTGKVETRRNGRGRGSKKKSVRGKLKDMLGLGDLDDDEQASAPPDEPVEELTGDTDEWLDPEPVRLVKRNEAKTPPVPPTNLDDLEIEDDPFWRDDDDDDADTEDAELRATGTDDDFIVDEIVSGDEDADDGGEDGHEDVPRLTTTDFLSASPVFSARGKPVRSRKPRMDDGAPATDKVARTGGGKDREESAATAPGRNEDAVTAASKPDVAKEPSGDEARETAGSPKPPAFASSSAAAVAAVAAEVNRLGVPEGHRARTRAALLDLARLLDSDELNWEGLRGAVAFAMEFPAVGRRILPLLIPFLDEAA